MEKVKDYLDKRIRDLNKHQLNYNSESLQFKGIYMAIEELQDVLNIFNVEYNKQSQELKELYKDMFVGNGKIFPK